MSDTTTRSRDPEGPSPPKSGRTARVELGAAPPPRRGAPRVPDELDDDDMMEPPPRVAPRAVSDAKPRTPRALPDEPLRAAPKGKAAAEAAPKARTARASADEVAAVKPKPRRARASEGRSAGSFAATVVTTVQHAVIDHRREILLTTTLGASAFTLVALVGWTPTDPTWARPSLAADAVVQNPCGPLGANVADLLYRSLGYGVWVPLGFTVYSAVSMLARRALPPAARVLLGGGLWLTTLSLLELLFGPGLDAVVDTFRPGGALGAGFAGALAGVLGAVGTFIALFAVMVSAGGVLFRVSWTSVAQQVVGRAEAELPRVKAGAIVASGAVGGVAKRSAAGVGRGMLHGLARIGDACIAGVSGAGTGAVTVVARAKDALTRTDASDADPESWSAAGLLLPEAAPGRGPLDLPIVPPHDGPDTHAEGDTAPSAEVGWESTGLASRPDEVLHLFPGAEHRRQGERPSDPDTVAANLRPRAGKRPVAPVAERALDEVREMPKRPVARRAPPAPVVDDEDGPRTLAPEDHPDDEDDSDVGTAAPARPPVARASAPAGDLRVEAASGLVAPARVDDGQSVSDHSTLFFELPPLSLLDHVPEQRAVIDADALRAMAATVEEALASFKVTGQVTDVRVGPVVTIFEFKPDAGIKARKVANLSDDLAMALKARSVRVIAPVPGKDVVGIEIPSLDRMTIYLRELLASSEFRNSPAALPVVLGKDVEGRAIVDDLAAMPHLLVGGTTGSGKSVGVNGMLMSLLYTRTPEELRLLLIDPKKLEFGAYAGIPHLLHPVITDAQTAAAALAWACREMERRYTLLERWGTRNISGFNKKVAREAKSWTREKARQFAPVDWPEDIPPPGPEMLPYIVIVIDELADLMMVAKKEVQDSIVRLAQMARACGMHLICATQRPSVDVVTGLIKSNMPTRIAFKLRSVVDSRTILDQGGAEKLLGRGDLLWLPGAGEVRRVHGPFASDDEVNRVIEFLREQREPDYIDTISAPAAGGDGPDAEYDDPELQDELYDQALEIVMEKGKASTSMIQRHLKIGYNRAARLIDAMEKAGVVGPADGARPREVLVGDRR